MERKYNIGKKLLTTGLVGLALLVNGCRTPSGEKASPMQAIKNHFSPPMETDTYQITPMDRLNEKFKPSKPLVVLPLPYSKKSD